MTIRKSAVAFLLAIGIVSCRSTELVQVDPELRSKPADSDLRMQKVQAANFKVQQAVANAGCSLGVPEGPSGSRVLMVERNQLPFNLPAANLSSKNKRVQRMQVIRVSIPLAVPRTSAVLACLLPAGTTDATSLRNSVAKTGAEDWANLASRVSTEGSVRSSDLYRSVADVLLDSTMKAKPTITRNATPGLMSTLSSSSPEVMLRAYGNVVVVDVGWARGMFNSNYEAIMVTWEMDVAQLQWEEDCNDWNAQMDIWDATKDAVADAADDVAEELESLADVIESGLGALETSTASCEPTNGKKMCIDFFIMNCAVAGMQGDCRDFNANADYASSRVQLYLDPNTMLWEVKYNCSSLAVAGLNGGGVDVRHGLRLGYSI